MNLDTALLTAAPFFHLMLFFLLGGVFIVLLTLRKEKEVLLPWKVIFAAVLLLLVELALGIAAGYSGSIIVVRGFLDLLASTLFIYAILVQLELLR
ncbi:hypothetical protein GF342_03840 [Candidatus Woesearchaeota archaeon]|nr:hypothetical protein [Candidatus Woesearchaeota archaeon]